MREFHFYLVYFKIRDHTETSHGVKNKRHSHIFER